MRKHFLEMYCLSQIKKESTPYFSKILIFLYPSFQLHHDHVIDTSEIYSSPRGHTYKASLKYLTSTYLK